MNSRDRISAVFCGGIPDRVPLYDQAIASTVASGILGRKADTGSVELHYAELCSWDAGEEAHAEFERKIYRDLMDVARELNWDAVHIPWRISAKPARRIDEFTFMMGDEDAEFVVLRYYPDTHVTGELDSSLKRHGVDYIRVVTENLEKAVQDPARLELDLHKRAGCFDWLRGDSSFRPAIAGSHSIAVPPVEEWLLGIALFPDVVDRYLEAQLAQMLCWLKVQKEHGVDFIMGGGDLCDNTGPMYDPAFFRAHLLPRLKKTIDFCNEIGLHYVFRSDGRMWPLLPMIHEEAGAHGYGEIDRAAGMELDELHAAFPRMVLWGGVACGAALERGSVEDVRSDARGALSKGMPGGRYIFGSSNSILWDSPPANVLAMYETALAEGSY
ncbi:MAG: hypothetical protein JW909_09535 [Planctomycetes bacterium]|nr:hypothetical protein [Planctomycetota bacterium]